jgi:hypothetical protein
MVKKGVATKSNAVTSARVTKSPDDNYGYRDSLDH